MSQHAHSKLDITEINKLIAWMKSQTLVFPTDTLKYVGETSHSDDPGKYKTDDPDIYIKKSHPHRSILPNDAQGTEKALKQFTNDADSDQPVDQNLCCLLTELMDIEV